MKERIDQAASDLRRYYNMRILEVLVKITRNALDEIRKRVLHVRSDPGSFHAIRSSHRVLNAFHSLGIDSMMGNQMETLPHRHLSGMENLPLRCFPFRPISLSPT